MKKFLKNKICVMLCVITACVCVPSLAANPGSNDDPLVSLSYVNDVLMPQIRKKWLKGDKLEEDRARIGTLMS